MSHGYDSLYNSAKSDDFTFYLNDLLIGGTAGWTAGRLHKYMDFDKLRVHSTFKSTFPGKQGESLPLTDYFTPAERPALKLVS